VVGSWAFSFLCGFAFEHGLLAWKRRQHGTDLVVDDLHIWAETMILESFGSSKFEAAARIVVAEFAGIRGSPAYSLDSGEFSHTADWELLSL